VNLSAKLPSARVVEVEVVVDKIVLSPSKYVLFMNTTTVPVELISAPSKAVIAWPITCPASTARIANPGVSDTVK
jgi:hypothetical protein